MKTIGLVLLLGSLVGCGGGPLCTDTTFESDFIAGCTNEGASTSFCRCAFNYLAERHQCSDFGNITYNQTYEAAQACL